MALAAGAWGVLVTAEWAAEAVEVERGAVLLADADRGAAARWRAPGGATLGART